MELVPVKSKKGRRKSASMFPALPVNINLQEKLSDMTKQGQSIYKDIYRRAKVLRSSPFEGMLLKATWPGPEPIAPEILNEIVRHSIPAFKYGSSVSLYFYNAVCLMYYVLWRIIMFLSQTQKTIRTTWRCTSCGRRWQRRIGAWW